MLCNVKGIYFLIFGNSGNPCWVWICGGGGKIWTCDLGIM